jgi:putative FmdB family regulatory protein
MYEYACDTCGKRFEIRQSFSDDPLTTCPDCTSPVRRVLHPAGVIFKGSGWYITDSRRSNDTASKGAEESKPSENGKSTSGSGDDAKKTPATTTTND